ncbi:hypothetical protein D3C76_969760 [compost metagenome]
MAAGSNFRQGHFMQFDIAETHRQRLLADCRSHYIVGIAHQTGIGGHFLALGLAKQRVQWHALATGSEIPQRDVDTRDGKHRHPITAKQMQAQLQFSVEDSYVLDLPIEQ